MHLPKHDYPVHNIILPISGAVIKFRPYVVKERKLLTMAVESEDNVELIDTMKQIINNCVISSSVDLDTLPIVDSEYLFYNLRARSESEIIELKYKCENPVNGKACGNILYHDLNLLTDLEVTKGVEPTITFSDEEGIKLSYEKLESPTTEELPEIDKLFLDIAKNVEYIYDKDNVYYTKDMPIKNVVEYLEQLTPTQFYKIEQFFKNQPQIIKKVDINCTKCGMNHEIVVEDIFDFFT